VPHHIIWSWHTVRWWVCCYIWYSEERTRWDTTRRGPFSLHQM